jgi:DNA-binding NarL/FixJ family response regulator
MQTTSVILVDDHPPLRMGVAAILERSGTYSVVAEVGTVDSAIESIRTICPEIAIIDISLPDGNGLDIMRALQGHACDVRFLMLSMHARRSIAEEAVEAGASGYMLKESTGDHLISALDQILEGAIYLDPRLAPVTVARPRKEGEHPDGAREIESLSDREFQVFELIARGRNAKEIGAILSISSKTVDNHRASIMEKLGAESVADIVRIAIRTGAIEP